MSGLPHAITLARRFYSALTRLYPPPFRAEYEAEMTLLFADMCRDAHARGGTWGVVRVSLSALVDTLRNGAAEWLALIAAHRGRAALFTLGLLPLGLSWVMLYMWGAGATELLLVPWDTIMTGKPAPDTLPAIINNFFEAGIGAWILAYVLLLANVGLLMRALRCRFSAWLPWQFALINMVYFVASFAIVFGVASQINHVLFPRPIGQHDAGFHRTLLPLMVFIALTLLHVRTLGNLSRPHTAGLRTARK